jgi:hypothetical protein
MGMNFVDYLCQHWHQSQCSTVAWGGASCQVNVTGSSKLLNVPVHYLRAQALSLCINLLAAVHVTVIRGAKHYP